MEKSYDPAGRTLLKTTGVIMLIFGILGILIYAAGLAVVVGLTYATSGIFSASDDLIGMSLLLAAAIAELIAGILGVRAANRPRRAGIGLIVWGLLTLALTLAGMIHIALRASTAPLWELVLGILLGVVTPVVYLVAVARVLKGAVYEQESSDDTPEADNPDP
jgi:hypothetical protein